MSTLPSGKKNSTFISQWTIACAIGFAIGGAFGAALGEKAGFPLGKMMGQSLNLSTPLKDILSSTIAGLLMSVFSSGVTGFAQWLVIRRYISHAIWWILASMAGAVLGSAINSANAEVLQFAFGAQGIPLFICGGIFISPLVGLASGLPEWLILRAQLPRAGWWIVLRVVSEIVSTLLSILAAVFSFMFGSEIGRYICNGGSNLAMGILFGMVSGFTLNWMINQRENNIHTDFSNENRP